MRSVARRCVVGAGTAVHGMQPGARCHERPSRGAVAGMKPFMHTGLNTSECRALSALQVLMQAVMWIEPAVAILQHKKRGYLQQPEQVAQSVTVVAVVADLRNRRG